MAQTRFAQFHLYQLRTKRNGFAKLRVGKKCIIIVPLGYVCMHCFSRTVSNLAQFNIRYGKQVGKHTHTLYSILAQLISFSISLFAKLVHEIQNVTYFERIISIFISALQSTCLFIRLWCGNETSVAPTISHAEGRTSSDQCFCARSVYCAAQKWDPFKLKLKLKLHRRLNDITATEPLSKLYGHTFN